MKIAIKLRRRRRPQSGHPQGSQISFRALMREHQSMVFSIAHRIVGDPRLAEGVAQDVFLQLYDEVPSLASDAHLVGWLRRVTVHRAMDQARRRLHSSRQNAAIDFAEPRVPAVRQVDFPIAEPLQQRIASLPIVPRTVIVLRYQEDLGLEEIAELLGRPVATVNSHLQRALKVLRHTRERLNS